MEHNTNGTQLTNQPTLRLREVPVAPNKFKLTFSGNLANFIFGNLVKVITTALHCTAHCPDAQGQPVRLNRVNTNPCIIFVVF